MSPRRSPRLPLLLLLLCGGCSSGLGDICLEDSDCKIGLRCSTKEGKRGICTYPDGVPDIGPDIGRDSGRDADDAGTDAPSDIDVDGPPADLSADVLSTDGLPTDGLPTDGLPTDGLPTDGPPPG